MFITISIEKHCTWLLTDVANKKNCLVSTSLAMICIVNEVWR